VFLVLPTALGGMVDLFIFLVFPTVPTLSGQSCQQAASKAEAGCILILIGYKVNHFFLNPPNYICFL
jgi:hypothetical protein